MANTSRRAPDRDGKIFFPRTVDGHVSDEQFMTGTKAGILAVVLVVGTLLIINIWSGYYNTIARLILIAITIHISIFIIRYLVFNEKYYYSMYNKMKEHKITSPGLFWDIINRQDTPNGCVCTFSDMKIGVYVKLERDSIVGKNSEFEEMHFDAVSEFYKEINSSGLKTVKADIMEQAGNDPRIACLDELVIKSEFNKNLNSLVGSMVSYTKHITRKTLYDAEYLIVYTEGMDRWENLINNVDDAMQNLLDGAYVNYYILDSTDIDSLVQQTYDVKIFDSNKASLNIYKYKNDDTPAFIVKSLLYTDGKVEVLNKDIENPSVNKDIANSKAKLSRRDRKRKRLDEELRLLKEKNKLEDVEEVGILEGLKGDAYEEHDLSIDNNYEQEEKDSEGVFNIIDDDDIIEL